MTILGFSGSIGSGKSHTQLKAALEYCERKRKGLVCNFALDLRELYKYCKLRKYHWCQFMILKGGVSTIAAPDCIEAMLLPNTVVCLDEAGVFLNSREFARTSKQLLADLAQSRKDGVDLIWAAQFNEQVDKQLRLLTQYWIHCDSVTLYDKVLRRPKLWFKRIYWMTAWDYNDWVVDSRARSSHFKTRFSYAFKYEGGFLNDSDKQLFKCFNSFARLDTVNHQNCLSSMVRCDLSLSYLAEMRSRSVPLDLTTTKIDRKGITSHILKLAKAQGFKPPFLNEMSDDELLNYHKTLTPSTARA